MPEKISEFAADNRIALEELATQTAAEIQALILAQREDRETMMKSLDEIPERMSDVARSNLKTSEEIAKSIEQSLEKSFAQQKESYDGAKASMGTYEQSLTDLSASIGSHVERSEESAKAMTEKLEGFTTEIVEKKSQVSDALGKHERTLKQHFDDTRTSLEDVKSQNLHHAVSLNESVASLAESVNLHTEASKEIRGGVEVMKGKLDRLGEITSGALRKKETSPSPARQELGRVPILSKQTADHPPFVPPQGKPIPAPPHYPTALRRGIFRRILGLIWKGKKKRR